MSNQPPYPKAQMGEETVGDVLRHSLNKRVHALAYLKSAHRVVPMQSESVDFGDYLIRTTTLYSGEHKKTLLSHLQGAEGMQLETSTPLFVGPKVSQSLLGLTGFVPEQGVDGKQLSNARLRLDIVPKHEGETISHYLRKRKQPGAEKIVKHFLRSPDALVTLLEQAAFAGMQDNTKPLPDFNGRNIMVAEKPDGSLHISHVDLVPPERLDAADKRKEAAAKAREAGTSQHISEAQAIGSLYVNGEGKSMHALLNYIHENLPKNSPIRTQFHTLCDQCISHVMDEIQDHTLTQKHPEWEGFTTVTEIAAIPLDAPSWVLKQQLDKLYAQAVPEQAR